MTLIEILIGLALATILLAQAAPDLSRWMAGYRLSAQGSALAQSLAYARSEAVTRGLRVTVCTSAAPGAAQPSCSSGSGWAAGWLVFVDNTQVAGNQAGSIDGGDLVLRIGEPLVGATVTASSTLSPWVAYTPDGLSVAAGGSSAGSILICQGAKGQRLRLNNLGHSSSETTDC